MKCSKCGKDTIDENGVSANQTGVEFYTTRHLDVPLIAYVCYSCGHVEFGTDVVAYNELRKERIYNMLQKYLRDAKSWTKPPIPISYEILLTNLATEIDIPIEHILEFTDGLEEYLNDEICRWSRYLVDDEDMRLFFRIIGSGNTAKIKADDRRSSREIDMRP